jgi:hypothetical protein
LPAAGQWRWTQRYAAIPRIDEEALTKAIVALATEYGRYDTGEFTALLERDGWHVGKDRVQRIWRGQGTTETEAAQAVLAERRIVRATARRDFLFTEGGTDRDRELARGIQHEAAALLHLATGRLPRRSVLGE